MRQPTQLLQLNHLKSFGNAVLERFEKHSKDYIKGYVVVTDFSIWSCQDRRSVLSGVLRSMARCLNISLETPKIQRELFTCVDAVCSTTGAPTGLSSLFAGKLSKEQLQEMTKAFNLPK